MPLTPPFRQIPRDIAEWQRYLLKANVSADDIGTNEIQANAVTDAELRDSTALSVIGRAASTAGDPADIAATVDDTFLVRRASALTWDALADADIPATIARDSEVTAAIAALKAYRAVTGTYTAVATDVILDCSGTFTLTLPTRDAGERYIVKNSGTGRVTVSATIDGKSSQILLAGDSMTVVSTGSGYRIV